jgi:hypothetical protein
MIASWIATKMRRFTGTQCERLFKSNKAGCQLLRKLPEDSSQDDRRIQNSPIRDIDATFQG